MNTACTLATSRPPGRFHPRGWLPATALLAGLLAAPAGATEWNWADDPASRRPEYAASVAACERVRGRQPPAADRTGAAQARALADCDSEALYYGIGMPADPQRARECAWVEANTPRTGTIPAFSGIGMLMTIYANGVGAARDLDLATALACRIEGAPFEVAGRVEHLQAIAAAPPPSVDFSFCDDITSGMAMAICARHDARLEEDRRSRRLDALSDRWNDASRAAFAPLRRAANRFARVSSENEVDLSGSGRWAFVTHHEQRQLDAFLALLETLESDSLPLATRDELQTADARLNRVYRQLMAVPGDPDASPADADRLGPGTVTRGGIREAQRAWIDYRDAWIAFAARHYWQLDDSVATWLARRRADDLALHRTEQDAPSR